jgi:hypothetical protein
MPLCHMGTSCGSAATISRDNIMRQAANLDLELPMLLPGITVSTSPKQYFPVRDMQLKRFNGEIWEGIGDVMRAK